MELEPIMQRFLNHTFKGISNKDWISTTYYYITDSNYRTKKKLEAFLKEQIENPDPEVLKLAKSFTKHKNSDKIIIEILNWVYTHIKYRSDEANFGKVEYWATASETLKKGSDDCDGINALIYVLFRLASNEVSDMTFFSCIGDVKLPDGTITGHYWNIYFSTKTDEWYAIDGTYNPNLNPINYGRRPFRIGNSYLKVWYMFNQKYTLRQG